MDEDDLPVVHDNELEQPPASNLDPRVILDCNIDGQAWLWNTENPNANLVFHGETQELIQ